MTKYWICDTAGLDDAAKNHIHSMVANAKDAIDLHKESFREANLRKAENLCRASEQFAFKSLRCAMVLGVENCVDWKIQVLGFAHWARNQDMYRILPVEAFNTFDYLAGSGLLRDLKQGDSHEVGLEHAMPNFKSYWPEYVL